MIVDIIAFALLALAIFKGFSKGFVVAVFSFLAFVIGLAAALKFSVIVAGWLSESTQISQRWLPVVAFLLVFIGVALLVRLGAKMLEGALRLAMLGWLNRLGGFIFYALLYLVVFSLVLFYATELKLISAETADASVTYSFIYSFGPRVIEGIGRVLPFFSNMFAELQDFFEGVGEKGS